MGLRQKMTIFFSSRPVFILCSVISFSFQFLILLWLYLDNSSLFQDSPSIYYGFKSSRSLAPLSYENYQAECQEEKESPWCKKLTNWQNELSPSEKELLDLRNVLLVVQFGQPNYGTASKIFALYRRIFADIVFCGPGLDSAQFWPTRETRLNARLLSLPETTRFVTYGIPKQIFSNNAYICLDLALENDSKAPFYDGVLVIADDVLLNYRTWKSSGLSLEKNWQISPGMIYDIDSGWFCRVSSGGDVNCGEGVWPFFSLNVLYQSEMRAFYDELAKLANSDKFWWQVLRNLTATTGGDRRLLQGPSGLFYISQKYLPTIRPLLRLLSKHEVWLEAGAMTAIGTVTSPEDLQFIDFFGYNSHDSRNGVVDKSDFQFVHPFKLDQVFKEKTGAFGYFTEPTDDELLGIKRENGEDRSMNCIYCCALRVSLSYAKAILEKFGTK